jgi:cell division protein FtsQ
MPQLTGKKNKLFFYFFLLILLTTINNKSFEEKKYSILKINKIEVKGLTEQKNIELTNQLKVLLFENIFLITRDDFKNILKKNNQIQSFVVKKRYPNSILVNIEKTKLLAITNFNNDKYFIGSNGKLIEYKKFKDYKKKIPFVFGKPNYLDFISFKNIIDKSKFSYDDIDAIYYFQNNRWDIKTVNGLLIKLPSTNFLNSLNIAKKVITNQIFNTNKIIDLRIPNHIITPNE